MDRLMAVIHEEVEKIAQSLDGASSLSAGASLSSAGASSSSAGASASFVGASSSSADQALAGGLQSSVGQQPTSTRPDKLSRSREIWLYVNVVSFFVCVCVCVQHVFACVCLFAWDIAYRDN